MRRERSAKSRAAAAPAPPNPYVEEARRLRLKKHFSQHFLVNGKVLERIAALMELSESDTVVEIGAGAGFLTGHLLDSGARVVAVELERDMVAYLQKKFAGRDNLQLIAEDILRFDFGQVEVPRFKVVGNLPYGITSKIMFGLCGELDAADHPLRQRMRQLTVMVQKEVAERITAQPGQRAYNPLSIALQYWFEPRYDFTVPSGDFLPSPKVESAVITLFPRGTPAVEVHDLAHFARLVRAAFAQKRKTVRNALVKGGFASAAVLDRIFAETGVNPDLRAEALSMQALGDLSNAFRSDTGQS